MGLQVYPTAILVIHSCIVSGYMTGSENRLNTAKNVGNGNLVGLKPLGQWHIMNPERISLIHQETKSGLSIFFATLCIVDIFGVFPIIALPRAIVQCGKFFDFLRVFIDFKVWGLLEIK